MKTSRWLRWGVVGAMVIELMVGFASGASAQGPLPPRPIVVEVVEVPEAETVLLLGGGLAGLVTWLGWQRHRVHTRLKRE